MEQKRLYKSSTNRVLCGVCGGIGEYFNIDPTIIRLIFVLFIFGVGSGLLAYIVAAIIMPEQKY
ncbi:PspC domain-containing protein [Roseburia sp. BX1005]|uniref:PspC domain-containing protein n=1 Tax=Roseburia zhanii TaxID=2763064 RepID=A0A923LQV9_9FIRM|nr:PspC domain-containing protein [Roseburia zhanii]MBC5714822.1 PspC domain-containing protein [Roseburia zhanii]